MIVRQPARHEIETIMINNPPVGTRIDRAAQTPGTWAGGTTRAIDAYPPEAAAQALENLLPRHDRHTRYVIGPVGCAPSASASATACSSGMARPAAQAASNARSPSAARTAATWRSTSAWLVSG